MRAPRVVIIGAAALMLVLAGCTGVPSSSQPETVEKGLLGRNGTDLPSAPTVPDTTPYPLVKAFLSANVADAAGVPATAFLTPAARNNWSDTKGVTIVDRETLGPPEGSGSTVRITVTGREVGSLDATGLYTPSPQGTGDGGSPVSFTYSVQKVRGQYRISNLPPGLVITTPQFLSSFHQQSLFFYDNAGKYLVADPRWSALTGNSLATWLLQQLVTGPSPDLQSAVNSAPVRASTRRLSVRLGSVTSVEIPGSAALPAIGRNQLAAQVSQTLQSVAGPGPMSITDGGARVRIPATSGLVFSAARFAAAADGPPAPSTEVYYLRGGAMVTAQGVRVRGSLGSGANDLSSIAVSGTAGADLAVAGVTGAGTASRLMIGTEGAGLRAVKGITGVLSRPSWAPGRAEVWVGAGPDLYRVAVIGKVARPSRVTLPPTSGGGRIAAVRVSLDGSRVAVVINGANGVGQLYVGAIVRESGIVRVDTLSPISPGGAAVTDVGWVAPLQLYAIGVNIGSGDPRLFDTSIDGSRWTSGVISGLSGPPDHLAASASGLAWVSDTSSEVWIQHPGNWTSPSSAGLTQGTAPVYVE